MSLKGLRLTRGDSLVDIAGMITVKFYLHRLSAKIGRLAAVASPGVRGWGAKLRRSAPSEVWGRNPQKLKNNT